MPQFKMTAEVDEQFILDVMTTIVESGALMWTEEVTTVDRDDDLNVTRIGLIHENPSDDGFVFKTIDPEKVVRAIQLILGVSPDEGLPINLADYIRDYIVSGVRDNDAGDIDEEAADAIAQVACMGEVIFG